ncbi:MAG: head-tail connector protein [Rhodobacteraceae bacterium]|nr:head-tail connector protein [Paracoccaceae bacterium]
MMLVELTTIPAAVLPVSEFAAHLHLGSGFADDGSQDSILEAYLRAALAAIEARIGKALIERDFTWSVTAWRERSSQGLPIAPVNAINAVKVVDRVGGETVIDDAGFYLERDSQRPRLVANAGALPSIPAGGSADVEFTAGFGPSWADIPVDLAQAVFLLAAHYYENRNGAGGRDTLMPFGVMALIETYRSVRLFGARA